MNTFIVLAIIGIFFNELLNISTDHALKVKLVMHHTEANDHWRREGIRVNVFYRRCLQFNMNSHQRYPFLRSRLADESEGTEEIQFLPQ